MSPGLRTQAPPPGPSARALFGIAGLTLALTCIPIGGGLSLVKDARQPVRAVSVADLMRPGVVPAGSFVTVTLTPDLRHLAHIEGNGRHAFLFGAHDAPKLVLYAEGSSDLGEEVSAVQSYPSSPPHLELLRSVEAPHTVDARVWDLGDYSRLSSDMPGYLVDDHAADVYGAHAPPGVRVLEVSVTPTHLLVIAALSLCTCGAPLLLLALFALVRGLRALNAKRAR